MKTAVLRLLYCPKHPYGAARSMSWIETATLNYLRRHKWRRKIIEVVSMAGKGSSRRKSADGTSGKREKRGRPLHSHQMISQEGSFGSHWKDEIKANWDPFWIEVNEEFESELRKDTRLKDLSNQMFYVWEGNHRTVAWIAAIREKFSTCKEKHCRVLCTIIDPTKVPEIALLSSLQWMNFMNTHALVACHLRDEIVNMTHICAADHEVYLKGLSMQDQALIAEVRRKYSKGAKPWYPLTRRYLARLVYDVRMSKEKDKRLHQSRHSLLEKEFKKREKQIQQDLTTKFSDKIGKLLNIVDPNLGTDWLAKVMGLKWGIESWATLEKLNLIALADAPIPSKITWLGLLEAYKVNRAAYGLKKGDHAFRTWLRREGFLSRAYERTLQLSSHFFELPGVAALPHDCTLAAYFEEVKFEARPYLFPQEVSLEAKTKDAQKKALKKEIDYLRMAAQRLAYRFLSFLVSKKLLLSLPFSISAQVVPPRGFATVILPQQDVNVGVTASHASQKGKEHVDDTTTTEEIVRDETTPGFDIVRRTLSFIYPLHSPSLASFAALETRCMAIHGWLLIMVSMAGDAIGWVERFCQASQMVVHRRIVVIHHDAYDYMESFGGHIERARVHESVPRRNIFIDDECEFLVIVAINDLTILVVR
ncbi:hypothetical protein GOP47_0019648 [Adiantum capillus-veneris]|uniref:Uncharacterized protein n=1 Tax=Adiantum capillus-veneris TaxID=13818 RepID=A0A9D4UCF2_ADICA|nr:hypothetical protein GOP47_0019648 [Adiantum capillus-veneris]